MHIHSAVCTNSIMPWLPCCIYPLQLHLFHKKLISFSSWRRKQIFEQEPHGWLARDYLPSFSSLTRSPMKEYNGRQHVERKFLCFRGTRYSLSRERTLPRRLPGHGAWLNNFCELYRATRAHWKHLTGHRVISWWRTNKNIFRSFVCLFSRFRVFVRERHKNGFTSEIFDSKNAGRLGPGPWSPMSRCLHKSKHGRICA